MANLFLTIKFLETIHFHLVCGKSFLEWIEKKEFLIQKKKKKELYKQHLD